MSGPFSNLRVVELASVLAGPSVGQFFAELGAEVIKVENPSTGGDVTRSWRSPAEATDDRSAYFCSVNWGKKSVVLDLGLKNDLAVVHSMVRDADVVVASYKPGDSVRWKVDAATLCAINPALIYGQITGYGADNPRVGYDAIIQAESGFMDMNGEAGGPPLKMPVALVDVLAAHQLKEGLLVALWERQQTGVGKVVEVSLLHAALASLTNQATNWLVGGTVPGRKGSLHPNIAPYGEWFETADGQRLLLAVGTDKQFADLCSILKLEALSRDDRFASNVKRVMNRIELANLLSPAISPWQSADLLRALHAQRIPAGMIQRIDQALSMPEAQAVLMEADGIRGVRSFVAGATRTALSAPPSLGAHNAEILARYK
ncbi:MAG: CoA transferase [Cyclobacteriaceae bacterium]|nr:CoA transferase [Cyclobacteriaceae bacterium]